MYLFKTAGSSGLTFFYEFTYLGPDGSLLGLNGHPDSTKFSHSITNASFWYCHRISWRRNMAYSWPVDQEQIIEEHLSAVASQAIWLGMALGIAAGFVAGVYWPY
jgi:hypothetical protein